ncbi:cysteine proteinase [Mycena floridula]|nr:cysteine proteinase [Mycena floridula]KAJ7585319.1 cysteine proteinase [Mycena floridula]
MNRKRAAAEPLLPLRAAKHPRNTFIRVDGARASPSSSGLESEDGLLSRWKSAVRVFWDLSVDTLAQITHANSHRSTSQQAFSPGFRLSTPQQSSSRTFSPSTTPFVAPNRRRRRRMDPPPPPKLSTELFPAHIGSPSPERASSVTFENGIPRKYRNREHIFVGKHKKHVQEEQKKDRDALLKALYLEKQKSGFRSGMPDFEGWISYRAKLEHQQDGRRRAVGLTPSTSLVDLRALALGPGDRSRRHSTPEVTTAFLQSALEKARATLQEPKPPKPFAPSLEQLRLRTRTKDDEIERRLRGPKAPALPEALPPKDDAAVEGFFRKLGIISKYAREQVGDSDLKRLRPGQWLNDEIINFYGAMILGRSEDQMAGKENGGNKGLNVFYFTTFFWSKLEKDGYDKGRLAKWTKKVDIFTKDVVLVPVNHHNTHWTGAAINFRRKRIESYDSMNMDRSNVFQQLRGYLDAEHRNKKKKPFDFTGWVDYTLDETPQQENCYDCGVFTCQFLEWLSRGEEMFGFSQQDIPYLRRRMVWEIGNAKFWTAES